MPAPNKWKAGPPAPAFTQVVVLSVNPASIAANTRVDQTFTVKGIRKNRPLLVYFPALTANITFCNAHASLKDEVKIRFENETAGAIDPAAQDMYVVQF
jgi:hypothetical protein